MAFDYLIKTLTEMVDLFWFLSAFVNICIVANTVTTIHTGYFIYSIIALNYLCSYAHKISVIDLKTIFYNRAWNVNNKDFFFFKCVL